MKRKIGLVLIAFIMAAFFLLPVLAFAEDGEPEPEPEIIIRKENITIGLGEQENVYYLLANKDKYEKNYSFSTSDSNILTITDDGIFKGVGTGQADIIISTFENIEATDEQTGETAVTTRVSILGVITVNVGKAAQSLKMNASSLALGIGETYDLNVSVLNGVAYRRTFYSSNTSIATVDGQGIVTPLETGKVIISAKLFNGKTATCCVTVTKKPTKIVVANRNALVQKGSTIHRIIPKAYNNELNLNYSFVIGNPKKGTINSEGRITALTNGKTTVKVKTQYDNIYATQVITVVDNAFELNRNSAQVALNYPNVTRVEYGKSVQGRKLEAYVITNSSTNKYKKTLFLNFAVHGFEDSYARDGKVLVNEANRLIVYYAVHSDELGDYRLVIVPCANPDGTVAGKNNLRAEPKAFGRCTANHVDMNRDFKKFEAIESKYLRNYIIKCNPNIFLDIHGWYDEVLGTKKLIGIIGDAQGFTTRKENRYGSGYGYVIGYVHVKLNIPTALVEYKGPKNVSLTRDVNMINGIVKGY